MPQVSSNGWIQALATASRRSARRVQRSEGMACLLENSRASAHACALLGTEHVRVRRPLLISGVDEKLLSERRD